MSSDRYADGDVALDVLDSLLEGCQVISFEWRYLYVNDTVAVQGALAKEKLLGRTMMECYPGIDRTDMFSVLTRCMLEPTPKALRWAESVRRARARSRAPGPYLLRHPWA